MPKDLSQAVAVAPKQNAASLHINSLKKSAIILVVDFFMRWHLINYLITTYFAMLIAKN
jgi:hypothetical protein